MSAERSAPAVSIVLPFFNAARFLGEALDSVLAQTFTDWELLLFDDGSIDASTTAARSLAAEQPHRVRYLEHPGHVNKGQAVGRNVAMREARGKYLAFLDADDIWLPDKLEAQVTILERQPDAAMVYGPLVFWYGWTGDPEDAKKDFVCPMGGRYDTVIAPPAMLLRQIEVTDGLPAPCSVLLRREIGLAVGGFEESFGMYEDETFFGKIALRHPVYLMAESLDRYRQHEDSYSAQAIRAGIYAWSRGPKNKARGVFLRWLLQHVRDSGLDDGTLEPALRKALAPYEQVGA